MGFHMHCEIYEIIYKLIHFYKYRNLFSENDSVYRSSIWRINLKPQYTSISAWNIYKRCNK